MIFANPRRNHLLKGDVVKSNDNGLTIVPRLLRTSDAARYLNISPWKLRKLVHDAELPVIDKKEGANWLFDRNDLDGWVEESKGLRSC
jgi:excisionase family DNA binding protein